MDIKKLLTERLLILDGGLGTMIQEYNLDEIRFRGERFASWHTQLRGCNDLLVLTLPEVIKQIHYEYLNAGADIIATNTFNSTNISLKEYALEEYCYEINFEAAKLAKSVAQRYSTTEKPRFVAGSVGPTGRTASLSPDVNNPAFRNITFNELYNAYRVQIGALIDGGADIILLETIFDTLNSKAAIAAFNTECIEKGKELPLMISGTITDAAGRLLSGQTVEAFYYSVAHARNLISIGLNCSFGAEMMLPYIKSLSKIASVAVSAHPNAGLPDGFGEYSHTPQIMQSEIRPYITSSIINIIGGCCGTTPKHIKMIAELAKEVQSKGIPVREIPASSHTTVFCGLEPLEITPDKNFINIGERANVAGSAKFARLIREHNYSEALSVAATQVEAGAQILDVCMDDAMIPGEEAMTTFLNLVASEPDIARLPIMIDSSKWSVIEAGLRVCQGKSIVNSISLKEGEAEFLRRAAVIRSFGAAAVVMLFDEKSQADTYQRKIEVARRAYKLLTEAGFPPEDIIFDPNILSIATGIEAHDRYGVDFIEACRWIKSNCPYAKVSGGVSNLSFALRGNNAVREAMHSVFLYHASRAGMDMGIVNAGMLQIYDEIEPQLLTLVEDVVLAHRDDATERLLEYVATQGAATPEHKNTAATPQWRILPVSERLAHSLIKGVSDFVESDALEAMNESGSPINVIEGALMNGMRSVGALFGEGKMFLPQVVKSARVMKKAVDVLRPYIDAMQSDGSKSSSGKVVIATVKGDVHDIGKNIVGVVLGCNGYEVTDLGVMTPAETIIQHVIEQKPAAVILSGLITPSLDEMATVITMLKERGLTTPVMVGGATTSALHTAVKLAPLYNEGIVVHTVDASGCAQVLSELTGSNADNCKNEIKRSQEELRSNYYKSEAERLTISPDAAYENRFRADFSMCYKPQNIDTKEFSIDIESLEPLINWTMFFAAWQVKGIYPNIFNDPEKGEEAKKLFDDAQKMLQTIKALPGCCVKGVTGIFPASSRGNEIVTELFSIDAGRNCNKKAAGEPNLSLADFIAPENDYIGAFAVTAGNDIEALAEKFKNEGDNYLHLMVKLLSNRLAEAGAEWLHYKIRTEEWGYNKGEAFEPERLIKGNYPGIRPAPGYPALPDHAVKRDIFKAIQVTERIGITLTESNMMQPTASICGLYFAHPNSKYFVI